jgi:hypothetical protein
MISLIQFDFHLNIRGFHNIVYQNDFLRVSGQEKMGKKVVVGWLVVGG